MLLVDVEARAGFATEHTIALEFEEVFVGLRVNRIAVRICLGRQIDLSAVNVKQAARSAGSERGCLGRVDHIVRHAGHFGREGGLRNETLKGADTHKIEMQAARAA